MKQLFTAGGMTFTEDDIITYLQNSLIKDYEKSKVSIKMDF